MNMDAHNKGKTLCTSMFAFCLLWVNMAACAGINSIIPTPSSIPPIPTEILYATFPIYNTPTPVCLNGLTFVSDITIPDNTIVTPGSTLDKQWLVLNSGTCNWDERYLLRFINGDPLGAPSEQALFPARAGVQATVEIIFTAPVEAGNYLSQWQAFDMNGNPFGDSFYIKIIVQP